MALVETVNDDLELLVSDTVSYQVVRAFSTVLAKGEALSSRLLQLVTDALNLIMNEVENSMAEDEIPREWITTNIRLLTTVINAEAVKSSEFNPPQSGLEVIENVAKPVVTVNSSSIPSDASSVGVKLLQYNTNPRNFSSEAKVVSAQVTIYGNEANLIRRKLITTEELGIDVTLLNNNPIDYNQTLRGESGTVYCYVSDSPYVKSIVCLNNQTFNIYCNGSEAVQVMYKCPDIFLLPACTIWNGVNRSTTNNCHVSSFTNKNTTCHCDASLMSSYSGQSASWITSSDHYLFHHRKIRNTYDRFPSVLIDHDGEIPTLISNNLSRRQLMSDQVETNVIEFGTILTITGNHFASTLVSVQGLTARDIRHNLVIVITISVVLALTLFGMFFFVRLDRAIFTPETRNKHLKWVKETSTRFDKFLDIIRPVEFHRSPWYTRYTIEFFIMN
jgi:hypothetical protein